MPIISALGAMSSRGLGEFAQSQAQGKYIEDYFSTYLYTGNGSTQTINNGVGLADTAAWSSYVLQGSGNDTSGQGITVDSSGNVYLCGSDLGASYSGTRYAALTAKYDSSGVLQWQRIAYSSSGNNTGGGVAVDTSGNVYSLFYNSASGNAFNLRKYDSSGSLQWQRNLGGGAGINSIARSVSVDSSSNVYVVGRSPQYSGDSDNIIVAKYNSSGTIQWQKSIRQSTFGEGEAIAIDSSDNLYIAGSSYDGSYTYAILIKMDTSGAITWQRSLRHSSNGASGYSVAVDSSGNAYMGGTATDNSGSYSFVAKFNSSGTLQWSKYFYAGTSASQIVRGIYVNSSGDVHIAAKISTSPSYVGIAKFNSSGTLQWQRAFPSVSSLNNNCLSGDSTGNLYLNLGSISNTSQAIVKLKSDGTTVSGSAFVTMVTGSATSGSTSISDGTSTATNNSGSLTTATGAITDYAGGLTNTLYTQAAVTGAGGLVWMKGRSGATDHALYDTARGATFDLASNTTAAQTTQTTGLTAFSASGFSIGSLAKINTNSATYASWTFREQPKFFDVVTWTGNGANRTISHNLGSVPGMILVKRTSGTATDWAVYHRSLANSQYLVLNTTANPVVDLTYWNNTAPTSTVFSIGTANAVNASGSTYVAYLFAHNAGGFGADGSQNVITCGIFTTNGSGTATVTLGYEPQFIIAKDIDFGSGPWVMLDTMRGWNMTSSDPELRANSTAAELSVEHGNPTATGFVYTDVNFLGTSHIYMAIRRGPMKTPTDATTVFNPIIYTGTGTANRVITTSSRPDIAIWASRTRTVYADNYLFDRLRGVQLSSGGAGGGLQTNTTAAEYGNASYQVATLDNVSLSLGASSGVGGFNYSGTTLNGVFWSFTRAPSFADQVCYTGTGFGVTQTLSHSLGVTPELIILKKRGTADGAVGTNWGVWSSYLTAGNNLFLNSNAAQFSSYLNITANSSTFADSIGYWNLTNLAYTAYLFASCPGVSKVGTYTGTGATLTVNCGFSGGARYVLIKRINGGGNWSVWDSARGMVSGTDPRLLYDSTAAELNNDWVYTTSGGFQIVTNDTAVNASGGTYLYLAIA